MSPYLFLMAKIINPQKNTNKCGEFLRDEFFNQSKGIGCYSTFEVNESIKELPDEIEQLELDSLNDVDHITWHCYEGDIQGTLIKMRYYWEGDGILEFVFPDGSRLYNSDCKKDKYWEFIPKKGY